MSTAMQATEPKEEALRDWVQTPDAQREIAAAVGDIMPSDQFIAHMLVAFQDEKIRACSAKSKYRALTECAAMGLLPTLGQVVLIPYKTEVKAMPQWQGFKALMERHPDVLEVIGVLVHVKDQLSIQEGELHHSYDPFDADRDFQSSTDLRGGYCKIVYRDGRPPKYHIVRRKTIEQAQSCAQTQNIWKKWYYEMALKTVYRNAYARRAVPIDPLVGARLERVLKIEDVNLGNDPVRIVSEASVDHIEEARRFREITEQPQDPPTPEEQSAAEGSQVDPAVEKTEGVDDPPYNPEEEPTQEEIHDRLNARLEVVATIKAVQELAEMGAGTLVGERAKVFDAECVRRVEEIRAKRGAGSNQPSDGELFPTTATATERGE